METLVGVLFLGKIGFIIAFAYLSVRAMQKLRDSDEPKSALSRDGVQERMKAARMKAARSQS